MTVGNRLEDFFTQIYTKFYHPLLMTRWTEVPPFTRKSQQKFMSTFSTFDPCKAIMEDATVKIAINDLPHIGSVMRCTA